MSNDSSTGGFLVPGGATAPGPVVPLDDAGLDALLQQLVVGITGFAGSLVRPRWQETPPAEPATGTNWCAIGVTQIERNYGVVTTHHPDNNGWDETRQQELITVLATFYGPNAQNFASLLRDGIYVPQNRELLFANFMSLRDTSGLTHTPDLVNNSWRKRVDVYVYLSRMVTRAYPVKNLDSAVGTFEDEFGRSESFDSNNHR